MVTTTDRGLGWAHQRKRAAALTALVQGSPCSLSRIFPRTLWTQPETVFRFPEMVGESR
jgi:hypothetical protein